MGWSLSANPDMDTDMDTLMDTTTARRLLKKLPTMCPLSPPSMSMSLLPPEPIKTCVNKPISLPRVSCEDLSEERTITVPEVEDATETVAKCQTQWAAPACQKVELTLPKQVCVELVYGYAHEPEPAYPHAA